MRGDLRSVAGRYEGGGCGESLVGRVSGDIAGEFLCSSPATGGRVCADSGAPPLAFGPERSIGGGVVSPSSSGIGGQ